MCLCVYVKKNFKTNKKPNTLLKKTPNKQKKPKKKSTKTSIPVDDSIILSVCETAFFIPTYNIKYHTIVEVSTMI